jgi:hypothetical protein
MFLTVWDANAGGGLVDNIYYNGEPCSECKHDKWDHFYEESWDSVAFAACDVEGCKCQMYEEDLE